MYSFDGTDDKSQISRRRRGQTRQGYKSDAISTLADATALVDVIENLSSLLLLLLLVGGAQRLCVCVCVCSGSSRPNSKASPFVVGHTTPLMPASHYPIAGGELEMLEIF